MMGSQERGNKRIEPIADSENQEPREQENEGTREQEPRTRDQVTK